MESGIVWVLSQILKSSYLSRSVELIFAKPTRPIGSFLLLIHHLLTNLSANCKEWLFPASGTLNFKLYGKINAIFVEFFGP